MPFSLVLARPGRHHRNCRRTWKEQCRKSCAHCAEYTEERLVERRRKNHRDRSARDRNQFPRFSTCFVRHVLSRNSVRSSNILIIFATISTDNYTAKQCVTPLSRARISSLHRQHAISHHRCVPLTVPLILRYSF